MLKLVSALAAATLAAVALAACSGSGRPGPVATTGADARAGQTPWSAPATLSPCSGSGPARAVFPREGPAHATGRGAIVWSVAGACPGGAGTFVSAIGRGDRPGTPVYARGTGGGRLALRPPLASAAAPHGLIVIAGSASDGGEARGDGSLVQGPAGGPFAALGAIAGQVSPGALTTAYLGDVAVASPSVGADGAELRVERYFAHNLSTASSVAGPGGGAVQALTIGLDYRTDAIAAWRRAGALYARDLPASGRTQPTQRLASTGPHPRITALISDDNRAMIVWADERAGTTSMYLDYSGSGVRFGAPRLLERFANPAGAPYPSGSPQLVRLSSESVMLAWSGARDGRWVVHTAAIDYNGLRTISTIDTGERDALLSDLQPGPRGEALALWSEPRRTPQGALDMARQAIYAARGIDAHPDRTIFGPGEQIAGPGPNSEGTVAIDPQSDRALALWRGEGGTVRYAIRAASGP